MSSNPNDPNDWQARTAHACSELIYWLALAVLVGAMCDNSRRQRAPLMLPTVENIKAMQKLMENGEQAFSK